MSKQNDMNLSRAQEDMRQAYFGGGPGVFTSGLVWVTAGLIGMNYSLHTSVLTFFFGGMIIHPAGIMLSKLMKRYGSHQKDNPLAKLALESTLLLFIGLFISFVVHQKNPNWFYPIMLMIIGGRYILFQTIYGMKLFWLLGSVLVAVGVFCFIKEFPFYWVPIAGGLFEVLFALLLIHNENGWLPN